MVAIEKRFQKIRFAIKTSDRRSIFRNFFNVWEYHWMGTDFYQRKKIISLNREAQNKLKIDSEKESQCWKDFSQSFGDNAANVIGFLLGDSRPFFVNCHFLWAYLHIKNCRLERDSNSDWQSWSRAHCSLDYHCWPI